MDERRIISWIVVIGVPVIALIWFFGYRGTLQIQANVSELEIWIEGKKSISCHSPCLIRLRAGKSFSGTIAAKGYISQNFETKTIEVFQKQTLSFSLLSTPIFKEFDYKSYDLFQKNIQQKFSLPSHRVFGNPLFDVDQRFVIFSEKLGSRLFLKIMDKEGNIKTLNVLRGIFDLPLFQERFSLQSNGVILPENETLYFYDFLTRRRRRIFSGPIHYLQHISVGENSFVAQIGNRWYRFSETEKIPLEKEIQGAYIHAGSLWTIRNNSIFQDNRKVFDIPQKDQWRELKFQGETLWIKGENRIWSVKFPS
jgi:hypothetical protein